mgnify:CR=1 FL=1
MERSTRSGTKRHRHDRERNHPKKKTAPKPKFVVTSLTAFAPAAETAAESVAPSAAAAAAAAEATAAAAEAHAIASIIRNLDTNERKAVLWMFQENHYGMRQFVVPKMNP